MSLRLLQNTNIEMDDPDVLKLNNVELNDEELFDHCFIDGSIREAVTAFALAQGAARKIRHSLTHDLNSPIKCACLC
jgi:hypothetical protein